jgi:hypothetical protein
VKSLRIVDEIVPPADGGGGLRVRFASLRMTVESVGSGDSWTVDDGSGTEGKAMVYRGRVKNGTILLEPGVELPDGAEVRIELEASGSSAGGDERDPLFRMLELGVETGIPDLATNIDHYLYGHPKVTGQAGFKCLLSVPSR